jgi:hypothetical protein
MCPLEGAKVVSKFIWPNEGQRVPINGIRQVLILDACTNNSLKLLRDDTKENILASFVDMGSILMAYNIGMSQLGLVAGILYGIFDAWIVVWQRKRISDLMYRVVTRLRKTGLIRERDPLPWMNN